MQSLSSVVWVLLASAQTTADWNATPPRVQLGTLNGRPEPWVDKIVTTCGAFGAKTTDMLFSLVPGDPSGVYVDVRVKPVRKSERMVCVTGIYRRRDGLTQKEAEDRRVPFTVYADMYNPDYIIRPLGTDPRGD